MRWFETGTALLVITPVSHSQKDDLFPFNFVNNHYHNFKRQKNEITLIICADYLTRHGWFVLWSKAFGMQCGGYEKVSVPVSPVTGSPLNLGAKPESNAKFRLNG